MVCSNYVSSWFNFGWLCFQNLFYFIFVVHSIFLCFFAYLWHWLLLLISYFVYLGPLFFLVILARGLFILFVLSKKPALDFIDIFYYCLISVLFISSLIFIISFLLMTLGSVYSFFPQVLLDGRIDYLRYYLFLEKGLYHEFPSLNYFCCIL